MDWSLRCWFKIPCVMSIILSPNSINFEASKHSYFFPWQTEVLTIGLVVPGKLGSPNKKMPCGCRKYWPKKDSIQGNWSWHKHHESPPTIWWAIIYKHNSCLISANKRNLNLSSPRTSIDCDEIEKQKQKFGDVFKKTSLFSTLKIIPIW